MGELDTTYGAMLIGILFATFFQGVLTVQAYIYYDTYPKDSWQNKLLVASVWVLDMAHLLLVAQASYHYLVNSRGNIAALLVSIEPLNLHVVFIGMATILCQVFFLQRIWLLSNHNVWLTGCLAAGCLASFALDTILTIKTSKAKLVTSFATFEPLSIAVLAIGAGTDVLMALTLWFYLWTRPSGFAKTRSLVVKIIQHSVATSFATSIVAVAALITLLINSQNFIYIAIHFSLGRMYTNALLVTLNSRRNLRETMISGNSGPRRVTVPSAQVFSGSSSQPRSHPSGNSTYKAETHEMYSFDITNAPRIRADSTASPGDADSMAPPDDGVRVKVSRIIHVD